MRFALFVLLSSFVISGCLSGFSQDISPLSSDFVTKVNDFGLRLLRVTWEKNGGNVFLSPTSLEICLSMIAHGARGRTQEEILRALGTVGGVNLNEENRKLITSLNRPHPHITLEVAQSLWAHEGVPFYEEYLKALKDWYQAEGYTADLANPETLARINDWVRRKTHGTIERILERLPEDAILVLLSAIFFKGKWEIPFNPEHTENLPFRTPQGVEHVPTMWQEGKFRYLETDTFQAIRLPYAGGNFSMYIFLPKEGYSPGDLLESLNARSLEDSIAAMQEKQGEIFLPRLQVTFEKTMNDLLQELGIREAFDPARADFGGILPVSPAQNAYLSEVRHKASLEVNEEGTTASGATAGVIGITGIFLDHFVMRVDHPFVLGIRDEERGTLLFSGVIENPKP